MHFSKYNDNFKNLIYIFGKNWFFDKESLQVFGLSRIILLEIYIFFLFSLHNNFKMNVQTILLLFLIDCRKN